MEARGRTVRDRKGYVIEPPKQSRHREAPRAIFEALAQSNPVTAGLARLFSYTHPSAMECDVASWREQVSDSLNRLEEMLTPRLRVGETGLELARWMVTTSDSGLKERVGFEKLLLAFPEMDRKALEEACFELEHLDFVSVSSAIGRAVRSIRPTYRLFWTFDPIWTATDPTADAVAVAQLMIEDDDMGWIPRLDEHLGWPRRRLNPAVAMLLEIVATQRTSKEIQHRYPSMGFAIAAEDRYELKRFINNASAPVTVPATEANKRD